MSRALIRKRGKGKNHSASGKRGEKEKGGKAFFFSRGGGQAWEKKKWGPHTGKSYLKVGEKRERGGKKNARSIVLQKGGRHHKKKGKKKRKKSFGEGEEDPTMSLLLAGRTGSVGGGKKRDSTCRFSASEKKEGHGWATF